MPPEAPPNTPTPPAPEKIAGKYADEPAALQGMNNILKSIGLDELPGDKPLIGENGHFKDRAAFEADYKRNERIFTSTRPPKVTPQSSDLTFKADEPPKADVAPEMVMEKAGLTLEEVDKAIRAGGLTPDQIKAIRAAEPTYRNKSDRDIQLIAKGRHAEMIDDQRVRNEVRTKAVEAVGGEQKFNAVVEWAKANVPKEELEGFNEITKSKPAMYPMIVRELAARHADAIKAGKATPLVTGSASGGSGVPATRDEFDALMRRVNSGDVEANIILTRMTDAQFASLQ